MSWDCHGKQGTWGVFKMLFACKERQEFCSEEGQRKREGVSEWCVGLGCGPDEFPLCLLLGHTDSPLTHFCALAAFIIKVLESTEGKQDKKEKILF